MAMSIGGEVRMDLFTPLTVVAFVGWLGFIALVLETAE